MPESSRQIDPCLEGGTLEQVSELLFEIFQGKHGGRACRVREAHATRQLRGLVARTMVDAPHRSQSASRRGRDGWHAENLRAPRRGRHATRRKRLRLGGGGPFRGGSGLGRPMFGRRLPGASLVRKDPGW